MKPKQKHSNINIYTQRACPRSSSSHPPIPDLKAPNSSPQSRTWSPQAQHPWMPKCIQKPGSPTTSALTAHPGTLTVGPKCLSATFQRSHQAGRLTRQAAAATMAAASSAWGDRNWEFLAFCSVGAWIDFRCHCPSHPPILLMQSLWNYPCISETYLRSYKSRPCLGITRRT